MLSSTSIVTRFERLGATEVTGMASIIRRESVSSIITGGSIVVFI